jgi:hypothetical protein
MKYFYTLAGVTTGACEEALGGLLNLFTGVFIS